MKTIALFETYLELNVCLNTGCNISKQKNPALGIYLERNFLLKALDLGRQLSLSLSRNRVNTALWDPDTISIALPH